MADTLVLTAAGKNQGAVLVDQGRPGYRDRGIPTGGPADRRSCAAANKLLDQPPLHPCLELTLTAGRWLLSGKGQLVLTGADMDWKLNGVPVARYGVIYLDGDYLLAGGYARKGCRAYLAIRGTWALPRVLGSVGGGLPGTVSVGTGFSCSVTSPNESPFRNSLGSEGKSTDDSCLILPVTAAPEWRLLSTIDRAWLLRSTFTVGRASNRQGIRLEAPGQPEIELPSLLSSPVLPGTVQLTPAGPILLGPDAHTVGGYPRILIAEPGDRAFQLKPGEPLRFGFTGKK